MINGKYAESSEPHPRRILPVLRTRRCDLRVQTMLGRCRKWANKPLSTALAKVGKAGNPEGGGCCIWYDEPRLLTAIEKRMAGGGKEGKDDRDGKLPIPKIEELGDGYALPEGMAAAVYGESRENEGSEECVA